MEQRIAETATKRTGHLPYMLSCAVVGAVIIGLVAWTQWWHHSDMRQTLVNGLTVLLAFVLLALIGRGAHYLRARDWLLGVVLSMPLGAAVFVLLARSTATACGTCPWFSPGG